LTRIKSNVASANCSFTFYRLCFDPHYLPVKRRSGFIQSPLATPQPKALTNLGRVVEKWLVYLRRPWAFERSPPSNCLHLHHGRSSRHLLSIQLYSIFLHRFFN